MQDTGGQPEGLPTLPTSPTATPPSPRSSLGSPACSEPEEILVTASWLNRPYIWLAKEARGDLTSGHLVGTLCVHYAFIIQMGVQVGKV